VRKEYPILEKAIHTTIDLHCTDFVATKKGNAVAKNALATLDMDKQYPTSTKQRYTAQYRHLPVEIATKVLKGLG